jgi:hypothetical protein
VGIPILRRGQDRFDNTLEDARDIVHAVNINLGQATHTTLNDANKPVHTIVSVGRFMANKTDAAAGELVYLFVKDKVDLLAPFMAFRKSLFTFNATEYPALACLKYFDSVWAAEFPLA